MTISGYSIIMAILWLSIFVVLGDALSRRSNILISLNANIILLLGALAIIRVFVPLDMKAMIVIRSDHVYPAIKEFFTKPLFEIGMVSISLLNILIAAWIIGAAYLVIKYLIFVVYQDHKYLKNVCDNIPIDEVQEIMDNITQKFQYKKQYHIYVLEDISIPHLKGLFTPNIFIPFDVVHNLPKQKLECIILHEWYHYMNHDLWIILFFGVFRRVFFWNPLVYLFEEWVEGLLEIRCDYQVVNSNFYSKNKLKYIYLDTLTDVESLAKGTSLVKGLGFSGSNVADNTLRRRVTVVKEYKNKKNLNIFVGIVIIAAFLLSYTVIIQPAVAAPPPDDIKDSLQLSMENSHIFVRNDDVIYLMCDGKILDEIPKEVLSSKPYKDLEIVYENEG